MSERIKRASLIMPEAVHTRLNELVPHGYRRHLLVALIQTVLDSIERDGEIMIGAIMARKFKLVRDE